MKNPLRKLVFASLKKHLTQNITAILTMSLCFCFVTAATLMFDSQERIQRMDMHTSYSSAQAMLLDANADTWQKMKSGLPIFQAGEVLAAGTYDLGEDYSHLKITVGAIDDTALKMSGVFLTRGDWPKGDDEIAVSQTSLMRMNKQVPLGESITLTLSPIVGNESSLTETKTFTLSGVFAENTESWPNGFYDGYEYNVDLTAHSFDDLPVRISIPTALVSRSTAESISSKFKCAKTSYLIQFQNAKGSIMNNWELISFNDKILSPFLRTMPGHLVRNDMTYHRYSRETVLYEQLLRMAVGLIMGGLSVLLLGSGIASSFETRLHERRQQTGLLRAIGASRYQVVRLVLLEALMLILPSILLGVGLGSMLAKWSLDRLTSIVGRTFTFSMPDAAIILWGLSICAIMLCFFALRPMLRLTKKSPVALLHIIASPKCAKRLRPQKCMPKNAIRFLAGRYRRLHGFRHVFPILVLATCLAVFMLVTLVHGKVMSAYDSDRPENEDSITLEYQSRLAAWDSPDVNFDLFELSPDHENGVSFAPYKIVEEVRSMPGIINVTAAKRITDHLLLIHPEQATDYVKHSDRRMYYDEDGYGTIESRMKSVRAAGLPADLYPWIPRDYIWLEEGLQGTDDENLRSLKDSLMAGSIDLEAIHSGEAVLLGVSSYFERPNLANSWEAGLTNQRKGDYIYNNDAFRVGDTITIGKAYIYQEDGKAKWRAITKDVRICGLVNKSPGTVYASEGQLAKWGFPGGVTYLRVRLAIDENYDENYRFFDKLATQYDFYMQSQYTSDIYTKRAADGTAFLCQIIFSVLGVMGMALLIGNTLSRLSIRAQEISLLRAVGMDGKKVKRLLFGEAVRDGLWAAIWGTLLGILVCALFAHINSLRPNSGPIKITVSYLLSLLKGVPYATAAIAFALFPLTGLAVSIGWIRRLISSSIVAGIRQVD